MTSGEKSEPYIILFSRERSQGYLCRSELYFQLARILFAVELRVILCQKCAVQAQPNKNSVRGCLRNCRLADNKVGSAYASVSGIAHHHPHGVCRGR